MKRLILVFVLIISTSILFAQEKNENSGLSKKEARKAELEKNFQKIKGMLENRDFVLESDFLIDRYGNRVPVVSSINFVSVDSTKAIIQIGSTTRIGPNGVGGVTAKGDITTYELTQNNKNKSFSLRINVMTPIGIYDLFMDVSASGRSTALLTGLSAGRLKFDGDLVPNEQSGIYVGRSL